MRPKARPKPRQTPSRLDSLNILSFVSQLLIGKENPQEGLQQNPPSSEAANRKTAEHPDHKDSTRKISMRSCSLTCLMTCLTCLLTKTRYRHPASLHWSNRPATGDAMVVSTSCSPAAGLNTAIAWPLRSWLRSGSRKGHDSKEIIGSPLSSSPFTSSNGI